MSNVEAIKKADVAGYLVTHKATNETRLQETPLDDLPYNRQRFEWEPLVRASTLEALQRENDELKERLDIGPQGEDAIDVAESAADFLRHRAEAAEAEVKRLREALQPFSFDRSKINIERFDEDNQAWVAIDGAGPDRLMFFVRDIIRARTSLASAGEEHHAE